jgi:hypothetical protein
MKMHKFLTGLLAAALCVGVFGTANAKLVQVIKEVNWRTSAANVNGYVDSLTASCNGALQTVDTTATIVLQGITSYTSGTVNTTVYGGIRVFFSTTSAATNANFDTIFVAAEAISPDGVAISNTTFLNFITGTDGDDAVYGTLQFDSDAAINAAGHLWGIPSFRLRVRADGDTAVLLAPLRCWLMYWMEE